MDGDYLGRRVYLGIRPEDLHETGSKDQELKLNVEIKEVLGSEIFLHGKIGRSPVCARLKPDFPAETGMEASVFADMSRILLFDMDTEENILYR